ncbi:MAG: energy transducer TonB [Acidobacteriota bacterium]|nr:energy transducer TonB [Acidobacteriota bacterium]
MKECLLKRVLPFTLTFIVGAAVGGFFQLFGARDAGWRGRRYGYTDEGRRGCGKKFKRNYFAPKSRPPVILFKPDARLPRAARTAGEGPFTTRVRVTFGEDGVVRRAEAVGTWLPEVSEAAARAALNIHFIPATLDGEATTVTEEVPIRFSFE